MQAASWRVRRATPEDLESLVRLRMALFAELDLEQTAKDGAPLVAATRIYLGDALTTGRFHAWLAETDAREAVACSGLVFLERPPAPGALDAREGYVLNMYTAPAWRGKGIARALMETLMAHARELHLHKLFLHASDDGRPLYERLGFRPNPTALECEL
jgi:GNAT superfamily N-acetyltransferase